MVAWSTLPWKQTDGILGVSLDYAWKSKASIDSYILLLKALSLIIMAGF